MVVAFVENIGVEGRNLVASSRGYHIAQTVGRAINPIYPRNHYTCEYRDMVFMGAVLAQRGCAVAQKEMLA